MSEPLGATRKFPAGKINPDDEGEVRFAVGTDLKQGLIVIDFGTPIKWMAVGKEQAIEIANALIAHAADLPDQNWPTAPEPEGLKDDLTKFYDRAINDFLPKPK